MDGRLRSRVYEEAHGSPLYTAPRKNINPSTSGDHIQEEISEMTKWVNQQLGGAGYSEQLVTDLGLDMADGITLLHLVQAFAKEDLPKHFPNPIMRVQKLENLQACLKFLEDKGVPVKGIHANDIAGGNMKTILAICHALKRFFTTTRSPKTNGSAQGAPTVHPPSSTAASGRPMTDKLSFSSLDREDVALLGWLGEIVHRDMHSYSLLYDGKILCDFANEIKSGAVSELDIISGSSPERLQIAFNALETCLFVRPHNLSIPQVPSGAEDTKLRHFLHSCRSVYQQMTELRRKTGNGGGKRGEVGRKTGEQQRHRSTKVSSPTKMNREEVFESLRSSSRSQTTSGASLEQREKAKVEARSLEGLRTQRKNGNLSPTASTEEKNQTQGGRAHTEHGVGSTKRSSSIEGLPSATTGEQFGSATLQPARARSSWHRSREHLPNQRQKHTNRQFSDIYITGDPSFSFPGPTLGLGSGGGSRSHHKSIELPLSPEDWELEGVAGRATHEAALSLSQPDHHDPRLSPSQLTPSPLSHGSLSRSVDHGLDPSPTTTTTTKTTTTRRQVSTPSPRHHPSDHESSPRPLEKSSSGSHPKPPGSSFTLPRTKKQSAASSSPSSPTPPPLPSVPPPSSFASVDQPTFVPLGDGARAGRKLPPAYPLPERGDSVAAEINDLHDSIALLSNQILYEKADVYTRLHRAVIRERKRRQAVERQLREFTTLARRLTHHYDNLFVQLGKEVAGLRQEVYGGSRDRRTEEEGEENRFGTGSGNRLYLTREIDLLKEQVAKLMRQQDFRSSHTSLPGSAPQPHPEHLFLRKRANSETNLHGPFMKGRHSSFKKVSKFFGEEPPRVETIETFLEGLGYSHLLPIFTVHQITLTELHQMTPDHLEVLGIPLGPRVRIMSELSQLEPLGHYQRDLV